MQYKKKVLLSLFLSVFFFQHSMERYKHHEVFDESGLKASQNRLANLTLREKERQIFFTQAVLQGNAERVKYLLDVYPTINPNFLYVENVTDKSQFIPTTPLMAASQRGFDTVVEILKQHRAQQVKNK